MISFKVLRRKKVNLVTELQTCAKQILADKPWYIPHVIVYKTSGYLPKFEWYEGLYDNPIEALQVAATKANIDISRIDTNKTLIRNEFLSGEFVTLVEILPCDKSLVDEIRVRILAAFRLESGSL